jgi:hypothetical protein
MAGITTYLSILILNINGLNSPPQKTPFGKLDLKKDLTIYCIQEIHLIDRNKHWLGVKRLEENLPTQWP